ncbi:MAG: HD domain-containing protein [Clostridia bacterium]|nr:HD domain-containing protein [Clostridia bacterium]
MFSQHAKLIAAMIEYDKGDARRIQHFMKVHDFSAAIAALEEVDEDTAFILETAAILHDIGIHVSEQKYGSCSGRYQEIEGPGEADKILRQAGGYSETQIERVKYLIGHHHTYSDIDGIDYQILVEADFLVNLYEDSASKEAVINAGERIFKTNTGIKLLHDMFGI